MDFEIFFFLKRVSLRSANPFYCYLLLSPCCKAQAQHKKLKHKFFTVPNALKTRRPLADKRWLVFMI